MIASLHSDAMRRRVGLALLLAALSAILSACGASAVRHITAAPAVKLERWTLGMHIRRVFDLTGPRRDGAVVVAAGRRLGLLRLPATVASLATGPGGYLSPGGSEAYVALASGERVPRARCTFGTDTVYALRLRHGPGVTVVGRRGNARRFVSLAPTGLENGIAFDETGRFGHRLLVTVAAGSNTTVYAIDCRGRVTALTRHAPRVEGGIAVAPASFGRFAGDLIAPDELSGRIYAIAPDGRSRILAASGLPYGQDLGVESEGFVPAGFGPGSSALLADRLTPGNRHPGDDVVLRLGASSLRAAGVRAGQLLLATEGGALTDAVACARTCRVRYVAAGPAVAHPEGHIAFAH